MAVLLSRIEEKIMLVKKLLFMIIENYVPMQQSV